MAVAKRLEDLVAWQKALSLCEHVYRVSGQFPDSEKFGLTSQVRRAAVSVPSNIAEGFGRELTTEMLRFLRIARGSLFEVRTQMILAVRLGYIASEHEYSEAVGETDRVLQGLIRSLEQAG